MQEATVLVLCPQNMTAPRNGPNGFLGDRIHQLPAVAQATQLYSQVYAWPEDAVTREVFQFLPVKFIRGQEPKEVIQEANELGIKKRL